ncbi:MAG: alpha/beta hydrolase-fold protein [Acidobacteriota bacterium]|nr:alpha/beta hydrolase-fold protein [Acidobacteriota bacterium]
MITAAKLLFLMLIAPLASAATASPLTIGETFTIDSKVLGEKRRINVYLPPQYAESADTRLPVLYMPDGGIAEDFLHVAGLVQVSTGNGTMRPFILVGIENTERRRDMTGPTQNEKDKKIAPRVGGSEAFRKFIRNELMPAVKARYRTTGETAIVGESLAGLFAVETFFREPDLFDTYIAFDPSLWWNDHALVSDAPAALEKWRGGAKTLYFVSTEEKENAALMEQLASALTRTAPAGVRWHYEKMPEEKHATIYHPAALKAFRALFRPGVCPPAGEPAADWQRTAAMDQWQLLLPPGMTLVQSNRVFVHGGQVWEGGGARVTLSFGMFAESSFDETAGDRCRATVGDRDVFVVAGKTKVLAWYGHGVASDEPVLEVFSESEEELRRLAPLVLTLRRP